MAASIRNRHSQVPLNVVQQNFGHASLNTTTIYTTQEVETRFDEMERFMKRRG